MDGWAKLRAMPTDRMKVKFAITIFIVAAAVRIFYLASISQPPLENDAKEYDRLGVMLAEGKGYVTESGKPTAYRPPVYPLFLAAIYHTAGHDLRWVRLVQALIGAGICVLVYSTAIELFDESIAKLSAVSASLYPPLIVDISPILSETLFSFLMLLAVRLIISRNQLHHPLLSGMVFGLALLTRPILVFFMPFLFLWLVRRDRAEKFKDLAVVIVGIAIILAPWTARNFYKLNAFVPLSNVGGVTLYNSYVIPQEGFGYNSLEGLDIAYFNLLDETAQSKFLVKKTIARIAQNPSDAMQLAAVKILLFFYPFDGYWYPVSFGSRYNLFWGIVFSFAIIGIACVRESNDINIKLVYFLLGSFLLGIVTFYGSPRFRIPIEPLLICFAAAGYVRLSEKKKRAVIAIVGVNLAIYLMFRLFDLKTVFSYLNRMI
jgi:4-amino-4-deoxy-L-arabinose transferase-like glycosyltransferase